MLNITPMLIAAALPIAGQGAAPARPPLVRATPAATQVAPPKPQPKITLPTPLWGYADLHAHPASHMSFGADENGNGGIFWGKPGLKLGSNPLTDMPACAADSHYGFDEDVVRKETRREVIKTLDGLTGWTHGSNGGNSFANWPHSQSIIHQQMHISAIRRAYDGGMRLMIASVTDSQMLTNLWTKIGFNAFGNSVPKPAHEFEFQSAKRQLQYIQKEASANAGWMQIVTTPAEAREAIKGNKLAVILSLEMDWLTPDHVMELVKSYKVRHVIPIHLANNAFGGTAVYSDVFNAASNYLNGQFFQVSIDPKLEMRLGWPQELRPAEAGSIRPFDVSPTTYVALGYAIKGGGHKNKMGLHNANFLRLMKAGLLLDLAHMSELASNEALGFAERYEYPVMNSHTGLRSSGEHGHSERDMMRTHAARIAKLGGVIGLGTEGKSSERPLIEADGDPVVRFTGSKHEWSRQIVAKASPERSVAKLQLTIGTGGDDLRGGSDNASVEIVLKSGKALKFSNINQGKTWGGGVRKTIDLPIPKGLKIGDLVRFSLITNFGGGIGGDNWNVDEIKLMATETIDDTVGTWLGEYRDAMSLLGIGHVALGTDINGFAPQMPFAAAPVNYPLTVAQKYGTPPAGFKPPALPKATLGAKVYDFQKDGIAHYGMLPDFLQALSQQPNSQMAMGSLYRSANEVVEMWEKVEAAAKKVK